MMNDTQHTLTLSDSGSEDFVAILRINLEQAGDNLIIRLPTNTYHLIDKELAKQYKSRKFYIVKVIDRDKEHEGVKFWRFKDNYKKEGVLDKIIPIWRAKGDVTDANTVRDLIIQLSKSKTNAGKAYTSIQTVMHVDPSPLHSDAETMKSWLEDDLVWIDVYSKKPVEYLEAISRGEVPKWNPETQKWVYGDEGPGDFVTRVG